MHSSHHHVDQQSLNHPTKHAQAYMQVQGSHQPRQLHHPLGPRDPPRDTARRSEGHSGPEFGWVEYMATAEWPIWGAVRLVLRRLMKYERCVMALN